MGSGLISRKDSLEQLRWKEDDTDFIDFFFLENYLCEDARL